MMFKFFIFFLVFPSMLLSNSLTCKFEEVYQNGDLQIGQIFIQDSKIRYQYQNKDLYTLIYKANNLYFIRNREPDKFEKITKNKNLFAEIMKIYNDFPDIELKQQFDGLSITLELNKKKKFIKRMGILSEDLALSIYFIDCENSIIPNNYFKHNPFQEVSL